MYVLVLPHDFTTFTRVPADQTPIVSSCRNVSVSCGAAIGQQHYSTMAFIS